MRDKLGRVAGLVAGIATVLLVVLGALIPSSLIPVLRLFAAIFVYFSLVAALAFTLTFIERLFGINLDRPGPVETFVSIVGGLILLVGPLVAVILGYQWSMRWFSGRALR
jgi:hypothetical protein